MSHVGASTYTHGEGAAKVIEDHPRTRVAGMIHVSITVCDSVGGGVSAIKREIAMASLQRDRRFLGWQVTMMMQMRFNFFASGRTSGRRATSSPPPPLRCHRWSSFTFSNRPEDSRVDQRIFRRNVQLA
jgi:hypothetical protein